MKPTPRLLRRKAGALVAAVPLVALLVGCGHATDHRAITSTVVGGATGYYPTTITVDKEDTLVLNVGNGTDKTHGFSIEGYGITKTVDPNQTLHLKFRLSSAGTFRIFCQLHPAHQTATLVVQ